MEKLDILAFGAHPDDVEIGMGGTLHRYAHEGFSVGICDLTKAELSSNGTVELRQEEAKKAGDILGLHTRVQLELSDRGLRNITEAELASVVSVIRTYRPKLVFAPYFADRHPDHGHCGEIVKEAVFNAGIRRYACLEQLPAHQVSNIFFYLINGYERPDVLVDITKSMEAKRRALEAYRSQFMKTEASVDTPLTNAYIEKVEARERLFGSEVGVLFAEGFKLEKPLLVNHLIGDEC
ncbi:bacillithiol biosynthesis deacetylase BshB1 [Halalkalibacterium ligniniphilum]|uniref:bacillithiol biosynthesis deacetylase BshB1 n=1 Tax=Halalkalibacterium ligniniphilum TaxID=1134413 RepID=UPI00034D9C7A